MSERGFAGVLTALVTPFRDGEVDEEAFVRMAERQIAAGVHGLVVASGVAGEAPSLREHERRRLIELCVQTSAGRVPVIAGAASNSTAQTIERVSGAEDCGAKGVLVATPWYNRPGPEGIYQHYMQIAEATALPVLIGLSPSRTAVDIPIDILKRLCEVPNLVGVEDACGEVIRASVLRQACGPAWTLLSGADATMLGYLAHGGHGCISLTANVAPHAICALYAACRSQDWPRALLWQDRLLDLHRTLAQDPAPAAAKRALSLLGLCGPAVRLPITPWPFAWVPVVIQAMEACGLGPSGDSVESYQAPVEHGRLDALSPGVPLAARRTGAEP